MSCDQPCPKHGSVIGTGNECREELCRTRFRARSEVPPGTHIKFQAISPIFKAALYRHVSLGSSIMTADIVTVRRGPIGAATIALVFLTLLPLIASCDIGRVEGFTVVNETDHNLEIVYLNPASGEDREEILDQVSAGSTATVPSGVDCTSHPVVARTEDGTEIARREPPICIGDTWVIDES